MDIGWLVGILLLSVQRLRNFDESNVKTGKLYSWNHEKWEIFKATAENSKTILEDWVKTWKFC